MNNTYFVDKSFDVRVGPYDIAHAEILEVEKKFVSIHRLDEHAKRKRADGVQYKPRAA